MVQHRVKIPLERWKIILNKHILVVWVLELLSMIQIVFRFMFLKVKVNLVMDTFLLHKLENLVLQLAQHLFRHRQEVAELQLLMLLPRLNLNLVLQSHILLRRQEVAALPLLMPLPRLNLNLVLRLHMLLRQQEVAALLLPMPLLNQNLHQQHIVLLLDRHLLLQVQHRAELHLLLQHLVQYHL